MSWLAQRARTIQRTLIRQVFDAAPPDAINLGLGQPDLPTPPNVCLAGLDAICRGRTGYTSTAGDPDLRQAVADRYGSFAPGADSVLITLGSQEAMFISCLALVDPGAEVLFPDPGYPAYETVARLVGAEPVGYPLRPEAGFRLLAEDVERRLTSKTRLVILCAPSNPTGACPDREELRSLTEVLEARGVPWVSDEIYAGFSYEGRIPVSPAELAPDGGLVISGLSKDMSMTGWRIGWIVGPTDVVRRATALHQYVVTCASSISQRAALAAFSPAGRLAAADYLAVFSKRRELMAAELKQVPGIRYSAPDGAFYFFVEMSEHGDSVQVSRRILERCNVVTVPGVAFGAGGEGYVRISFAATESDIRRGVARIAEELSRGA